jgi:surface polysaccharide O-acyltransferase-like enzyme
MPSSEAPARELREADGVLGAVPLESAEIVVPKVARRSSPRLANVERLRLIAMYEIVAFHVSEHRLPIIAGLGLPIFLLLNNAFNCTLAARMGTLAFLRTKVSRLFVPWVLWDLIYAGVLVLERLRHGEPLLDGFSLRMLVGGTYDHLWFVPFSLAGALLIAWLQERTKQHSHALVLGLSFGVGCALAIGNAWLVGAHEIEWPVLQWLFALPAVPFGVALGRAVIAANRTLLVRLAGVALGLALVCLGLGLFVEVPHMVRRYAVSMAIVGLGFLWPGQMDPVSQRLAPLLFGVYLCHPLLVRIYQAAHLPEPGTALFAAIIFGAAALFVVLLRRGPLRTLV